MALLALYTDVMQARHTLLDDGVKHVRGTISETPQLFVEGPLLDHVPKLVKRMKRGSSIAIKEHISLS